MREEGYGGVGVVCEVGVAYKARVAYAFVVPPLLRLVFVGAASCMRKV